MGINISFPIPSEKWIQPLISLLSSFFWTIFLQNKTFGDLEIIIYPNKANTKKILSTP